MPHFIARSAATKNAYARIEPDGTLAWGVLEAAAQFHSIEEAKSKLLNAIHANFAAAHAELAAAHAKGFALQGSRKIPLPKGKPPSQRSSFFSFPNG